VTILKLSTTIQKWLPITIAFASPSSTP